MRLLELLGFRAYHSRIHILEEPYMDRWVLNLPGKVGEVRLHRIFREDFDRELHDHPFDFVSIILSGGYIELTPMVLEESHPGAPAFSRIYRRGDLNICRAEQPHRLVSVEPNTWTLVFVGPRRREWGFHTDEGWVHWAKHVVKRGNHA